MARWLDRDALAAHISVRPDAIARLQKAGKLPPPSYHLGERRPRWDRDAVDAALSGGVASTDPNVAVQSLVNEILATGKGRPQASR